MKKSIFLIIFILFIIQLNAQDQHYKFRLYLNGKGTTIYTTEHPEVFLSKKSIERRKKQKIVINETDLPISQEYIDEVEKFGVVVAKSKWLNTISVDCADSIIIDQLKKLPFVVDVLFVWKGEVPKLKAKDSLKIEKYPASQQILSGNYYGMAFDNIAMLKGDSLHNAGFRGEGMEIAVIDAGFNHLPAIEMLDNVGIKGVKGFVYDHTDLYDNANQHGLNVLSCMAANKPMQFVGTAPHASYWLLGSEDSRSEYPIEEDYWVSAIEYADSVGVDVVNTSLGYNNFNVPAKSFTHETLDGKTALISRAADMATDKGIFVVCSAGNSGDSEWRKITPPSDARNVLTVGAVRKDSSLASFSSVGRTADLRIKPDVVALGSNTALIDDLGCISFKSGTSFSSPIVCGLVTCLWQAFPKLTNKELLQVIRESANKFDKPDEKYGYGIPNMYKAMLLAQKISDQKGMNRIGGSENFRIESGNIGHIRITVLNDELPTNYKITVSQKLNGKTKTLLSSSLSSVIYEKQFETDKKDLYSLTISNKDQKEIFQLYF